MSAGAGKRRKKTGRAEYGSFLAMPHGVLRSSNYVALCMHARALLLDVAVQYNGTNNGDLCAAWTLMCKRGWKSRDTLHRALLELRYYGFLDMTRQGGINKPSLYAITWQKVDECGGKLDHGCGPTKASSGRWREVVPETPRPSRKEKDEMPARPAYQIGTPSVSLGLTQAFVDTPGVSIERSLEAA
jgi:hypothetical protein